jgi:hypothetical protein
MFATSPLRVRPLNLMAQSWSSHLDSDSTVSELVSQWRHNDNYDPDHQRKRQSHLREVSEGVSPGLLYHQVRLESGGIDESAGGSHHQDHDEWQEAYVQPL